MSESHFSFTTKVNGDLFTIRGESLQEFAANLEAVADNGQLVAETLTKVQAIGAAAPLVNTAAPAPQAPAAAAWGAPQPQAAAPAAPPASFADAQTPSCKHGPRNPVSKTGAKGLWKAWFCSAPQYANDKCDPIWVDNKSAEWNTFPV